MRSLRAPLVPPPGGAYYYIVIRRLETVKSINNPRASCDVFIRIIVEEGPPQMHGRHSVWGGEGKGSERISTGAEQLNGPFNFLRAP